MKVPPNVEPAAHLDGIDLLRIVAMALVTAQHALALTHLSHWSTFRSLNVGQLGVAIFLAISAMLANSSRRPPVDWLVQRLGRLYPPYWVAMIVCFMAAKLTHYKAFGLDQVLSQMLGIGLFTHPDNLVNVPTWFISFILLCYLISFLIRLSGRPIPATVLLLASIVAWSTSPAFAWPWLHLLSFFAASMIVIAFPKARRVPAFSAVGAALLCFAPWSVAYAYAGIALLSTGVALRIPALPRVVARIANYSYEYYLVHGIALIATTSVLRDHPVVAVVAGVVVAALGSILLKMQTDWIVRRLLPR